MQNITKLSSATSRTIFIPAKLQEERSQLWNWWQEKKIAENVLRMAISANQVNCI